jgi:hypothetical protein
MRRWEAGDAELEKGAQIQHSDWWPQTCPLSSIWELATTERDNWGYELYPTYEYLSFHAGGLFD